MVSPWKCHFNALKKSIKRKCKHQTSFSLDNRACNKLNTITSLVDCELPSVNCQQMLTPDPFRTGAYPRLQTHLYKKCDFFLQILFWAYLPGGKNILSINSRQSQSIQLPPLPRTHFLFLRAKRAPKNEDEMGRGTVGPTCMVCPCRHLLDHPSPIRSPMTRPWNRSCDCTSQKESHSRHTATCPSLSEGIGHTRPWP